MSDHGLIWQVVVGGGGAASGVLLGVLVRIVLGRLARRAEATSWVWDEQICTLLRGLAVPVVGAAGIWWTLQILRPPRPIPDVVDRALLTVVVLAASVGLARLAASLVGAVTVAKSGVAQSASIFVNITRVIVLGIGVLILLQSLGVSITPLLTALGVGGLAVALALQDTLANLFAGVHILTSKKVQPGDYVCLDSGENGNIVDINWRNTTVRQQAGNLIMVPNARFADAIVTNFHRPREDMSVPVRVRVGYESDLDHVERVTVEVARQVMREVHGGMPEHEPVVRYHTFAGSSVKFSVILRGQEYTAQYLLVHEFIKRLHARYKLENIDMPYPTRTVITANRTAIRDHDQLVAQRAGET